MGDSTKSDEEQAEDERNQEEANDNERLDSPDDDEFAEIVEGILGSR